MNKQIELSVKDYMHALGARARQASQLVASAD